MGEKKVFKISLTTMILLIFIIVLLVVITIMGFAILNFKKEDNRENKQATIKENEFVDSTNSFVRNELENRIENKVKNKVENSVVKNTTVSNNSENEDNNNEGTVEYINKIVQNKEYIYNAQYGHENIQVDSYSSNNGNIYSLSEIVVPFVNMNSNDGNAINSEIQEIYNNLLDEFKVCSENKTTYVKANYKTYITSNIISILITIERGNTEDETNIIPEYIAYNFDSVSGTKLSYNQVYGLAGINDNEIGKNVQECINNIEDFNEYILTENRYTTKEEVEARNIQIETCQKQIYTYYQQDSINNKLVYFLDNNLKLNIAVNVVLPDNNTSYHKIILIEK